MRAARSILLGLLATPLLAACSREAPAPAEPAPAKAPAWPEFAAAFISARFKADPYFAVQSGKHEFDGQMPDWSRAALDADNAELRTQLEALQKYDPAGLDAAQKFEREYMKWVIETELFWRTSAEAPFRNPAWYLEKLDPSMYLTREYAPLPQRLRGFLGYARSVPA